MWGLIDQSPYNNHSTVMNWIIKGGENGNLSSVLITLSLLTNFILHITENHYQLTGFVFIG